MTPEDLHDWLYVYCKRFPEFRQWWEKNHNDTLRTDWCRQVAVIDVSDANEAMQAMADGEFGLEPCPRWDYARLATHLHKSCRRIQGARDEAMIRSEAKARMNKWRVERTNEAASLSGIIHQISGRAEVEAETKRRQADPEHRDTMRELCEANIERWNLDHRQAQSYRSSVFGWLYGPESPSNASEATSDTQNTENASDANLGTI